MRLRRQRLERFQPISSYGLALASCLLMACPHTRDRATTGGDPEDALAYGGEPSAMWSAPLPEGAKVLGIHVIEGHETAVDLELQGGARELRVLQQSDDSALPKTVALASNAVVTAGDGKLVVAAVGELRVLAFGSESPDYKAALPSDLKPTAVATGYGDVVFVVDGTSDRVFAADPSGAKLFVEAPEIHDTTIARRVGGRLLLGGPRGVVAAPLNGEDPSLLAATKAPIVGLDLDHVGRLVLDTGDGKRHVVEPDGALTSVEPLPTPTAFAPSTGTQVQTDGVAIYAVETQPPLQRAGGPFTFEGVALSGAEYWPRRGDAEPNYPEDILWGFYPTKGEVFEGSLTVASATEAAIACMEESQAALHTFVKSHHGDLEAIARNAPKTRSPRFYLWVNDYSTASDPFPGDVRPARLWFWQRKPAVVGRIPGYWKWETTVLQGGQCTYPATDQAEAFLAEELAASKAE